MSKNYRGHLKTTLIINNQEMDVFVEYLYTPGNPGCRTLRNGDPGYPPDPPEVEIDSISRVHCGNTVTYEFDSMAGADQDKMREECIADAEQALADREEQLEIDLADTAYRDDVMGFNDDPMD